MSLHWLLMVVALNASAAAPTEHARSAFDRGERALGAGQLDEAAAAYREALASSPQYADAHNGLGSVLFKQGQRADAVREFRAAIEADPAFKLAYFNLDYAERKTGDYAAAVQAYEKYTHLDPSDPDGYFGLAESHRALGQNTQAIAAYERYIALERRPSEQKWVDKAKEYVAQLRAAPSGGSTATASVEGNGGGQSRLSEGDRAAASGHLADAVIAYEDVVRADPGSVEAHFKLGTTLARMGSYPAAIEHWKRVLDISSDPSIRRSAQDNIGRAQAKLASGGGSAAPSAPTAATRPSEPAQATSPSAPSPSPLPATGGSAAIPAARAVSRPAYEQGVRQIYARDYIGALESLTQAITAEPSLAVAYVARGSARMGLRRYADAALDYQRALSLDPSKASPLYGLGEAYRGLRRTMEARQYYERYAASSAQDVQPALQAEARQKAANLQGEVAP